MAPTPRLPHQDNREARARTLSRARQRWRYDYEHLPGLPLAAEVPEEAEPSPAWLNMVLERLEGIAANEVANGFDLLNFAQFASLTLKLQKALGLENRRPTRARDVADFDRLFQRIRRPAMATNYQRDECFADLRLAGPNPILLRGIARVPDHFPVTDAHLRTRNGFSADSLAAAGDEGRLYLLDHVVFDGIEDGFRPYGSLQKMSCAPLSLFAVPSGGDELVPIAIQCEQRPNLHTPILTPDDGWAWLMAKTVVNAADGMFHELIAHFGLTHLMLDPVVVATHRTLAPEHPLYILLTPHFEGTTHINALAHGGLLQPNGVVDSLLAPTLEASLGIVVDTFRETAFSSLALPDDLAAREVTSPDLIYPYRDDALPLWSAIEGWVADYLTIYYRDDGDLVADGELRAFLEELVARDGGRLTGLGCSVLEPKMAELTRLLTTIIFTASVRHAAVNFPQFDVMAYQPAMPLALFGPPPRNADRCEEADWLALQPPLESAEIQLNAGYLLGTVHYTRLGSYGSAYFGDPRVAEPLRRFQNCLLEAEKDIHRRNRARRPYETLIPREIPQSINI